MTRCSIPVAEVDGRLPAGLPNGARHTHRAAPSPYEALKRQFADLHRLAPAIALNFAPSNGQQISAFNSGQWVNRRRNPTQSRQRP